MRRVLAATTMHATKLQVAMRWRSRRGGASVIFASYMGVVVIVLVVVAVVIAFVKLVVVVLAIVLVVLVVVVVVVVVVRPRLLSL